MHDKVFILVTLTLTLESAFNFFRNLRLGFEKLIVAPILTEVHTLYIWHTHAFGQDLSTHVKPL